MAEERCADIESHYRQRDPYAMALALHDALGWPIRAFVVDVRMLPEREISHAVHAWVQAPDGRGYDVTGHFDEDYATDIMRNSVRRLPSRMETFDTASGFICFLRDQAISDAHWQVALRNLADGRRHASRVVQDYVLKVHEVEQPRYELN